MSFLDKRKLIMLPISKIRPNPSQPRRIFLEDELKGLACSIKENGLLQPIVVRKEGKEYFLIAGERRLRASKMAKLEKISCIVSDYSGEESAVLAVIENMQRQDLDMFEEANGIINLIRGWDITQAEAAKRLGISQSYLANKIRILRLTGEEQKEIMEAGLSERHARELIRIKDESVRRKIISVVIERDMNVSETERLVTKIVDELEDIDGDTHKKKKPTRKFIAKDIRIFINTIDKAVDAMKTAGILAEANRLETDEYIECTVKIPKQNSVQV